MKQPFGARLPRSCLLSTRWIVASRKRAGAVFLSVTGGDFRLMDAMSVEIRVSRPRPHLGDALCAETPFEFINRQQSRIEEAFQLDNAGQVLRFDPAPLDAAGQTTHILAGSPS